MYDICCDGGIEKEFEIGTYSARIRNQMVAVERF